MTRRAEPLRLDTRGLQCPWPVLRAARAMRECDAVLLVTDDPVALTDVPALAAAHGWTVELRQTGPDAEFHLRKGPAPADS